MFLSEKWLKLLMNCLQNAFEKNEKKCFKFFNEICE